MDPHGRDSRYTLEMGDASLFPEMSIMSIDNRTIYSPPEPVAASTVVRSSVNRNNRGKPKEKPPIVEHARPMQPGKQRDYDDPKGSFLDCEPWSAPQGQPNDRVANQGPVACISFSDHCGPGTAYSGQGYPINSRKGSNSELVLPPHAGGDANRSSLGIIPQEMMQDNSFFNIEDVSSSELMNFGQEARNTHQSNRQQMSGLCSSSKDSHGVDSSSEQTMARSHAMGTVKKQTAAGQSERPQGGGGALSVVQTLLGAGSGLQEGEEAEASICEVQFEDAELADLDDDFSDFGELQFENEPEEVEKETNGHNNYREEEHFPTGAEDWFQYYCSTKQKSTTSDSPVSIAFEDDQLDVNKETCPQQGPLANSDSADTEDELEAVRSAMRQSLNNDRQNGVGSCEEIADDNIRPGLEGGSDHFTDGSSRPNTFVRQSAEGEVVISPVPGDWGGGGDGSSAPGSEDELFVIDGPPVFVRPQDPRPLQVPQDERRIRPVGDETRDSVGMQSMVNQPVLDSIHFKPLEMTHSGIDDLQQVGGGLAEESSYHFEDFLHSSHSEQNQGERLEASGFCQDEDFPFGGRNSLGSFGASPEKDEAQRPALTSNELVYPDLAEANDDKHQDTIGCTDTDNKPVSKIKKTYVSSESPVYIDENGEGVTDLAFQTSLAQEAAFQKHMFEEWGKDLPLEDPLAASMCREQEEFMDRSDALKMLQSDEQQFQEENIFIKDDKMEANPNSGLGDESWLLQTSIYLAQSTRMVDRLHEGDACMRISIGEFMRSRSEALGSLDGDAGIDRPQFGASIITPPTQRAPVALVKEAPCLKVCGTQNSSGTREDGVGYDTQGETIWKALLSFP
ncbi:uncharacterized protein LOC135467447 [Liolophura sinensis]|uniref:uncharacterized protein LOC135467447 n=1 Tax=Liolophura sinensis TaxID=3198878 RepID=UPI00315876B9